MKKSVRRAVTTILLVGLLCTAYLRLDELRNVYFYMTQANSMNDLMGHAYEDEYNITWIQKRKELLSSGNSSKLFMLSYMRGGSSVGGELFNCDPSATMWYEPGDAFFAHYYGLYHENIPQDDLYFNNETRRRLDKDELQAMTDFYSNKFTCEYDKLPPEDMTHYFLSESTAMDAYVACRQRNDKRFYGNINRCAGPLKAICSSSKVEVALKSRCHYYIATTRRLIEQYGARNSSELLNRWLKLLHVSNASGEEFQSRLSKLKSFVSHGLCVQRVRDGNAKCLAVATAKCRNDSLRVVQVNRMKMEDLEPLLRAHPDLHVMHYVRDPRAIAVSRLVIRKLTWHPDERQPIGEAKFLCRRMRTDLIHRRRLQLKYPGSITQVKYEDLVTNPESTAKKIYSIFGRAPPKAWAKFVAKNMNTPKGGGSFGVSVRNVIETTRKWRKQTPPDQLQEINRICGDVIQALGYSL